MVLILLAMLGSAPAPPSPPPPPPDMEDGLVRLTRTEYDALKASAEKTQEAPAKKVIVVPPSIESASYDLRVSTERTALELSADVLVKAPAVDARITLPDAGTLDSFSEKGPASVGLLPESSGRITVQFPKPGLYHLTFRTFLAEKREDAQRSVEFAVLPAAAARLTGSGSAALSVSVSGGPQEPLASGASRPLPASAFVRAIARTAARIGTAAEKPLLIAETVDVLRLERERLVHRAVLRLSVSRAPIEEIALEIPEGVQVTTVTGPGDPRFEPREKGKGTLFPGKPLLGDAVYSLLFVSPAPKGDELIEAPPTRLPQASSSRSYVLLEPAPLREQKRLDEPGLSRVDLSDLPPLAVPFAVGGTRAWRVTSSEAKLHLTAPLRKLEKTPDMLLVDAEILTVFGDAGSRTDRRRYTFETRLPSVDLPLVDGEEVLSLSVDGNPARPQHEEKTLVVSLPTSDNARRLVEVVSKSSGTVPPKRGELTVAQHPLGAVASVGRWTIVLPDDRQYRVTKTDGIGKVAWNRDAAVVSGRYETSRQEWAPSQPAYAGGNASMAVQVKDASGYALPGVSVELKSAALQGTRVSVTSASGLAQFINLPPGKYKVRAALPGFTTTELNSSVTSGSGSFVELVMRMESLKEEIVVTGEAPTIDTTQTAMSQTFSGAMLGQISPGSRNTSPPKPKPEPVSTLALSNMEPGIRSLPMQVKGQGKRLLLSGPLVGAEPLSVTMEVKPK